MSNAAKKTVSNAANEATDEAARKVSPGKDEKCTCDKNHALHLCPYEEDVNGNDDPEYCTCCPDCEENCADAI